MLIDGIDNTLQLLRSTSASVSSDNVYDGLVRASFGKVSQEVLSLFYLWLLS